MTRSSSTRAIRHMSIRCSPAGWGKFDTLRKRSGLSGYPSRSERATGVESSHASSALSYADGLAKAFRTQRSPQSAYLSQWLATVLTGGMCWEVSEQHRGIGAAGCDRRQRQRPQLRPTIGGFANHLRPEVAARLASSSIEGAPHYAECRWSGSTATSSCTASKRGQGRCHPR